MRTYTTIVLRLAGVSAVYVPRETLGLTVGNRGIGSRLERCETTKRVLACHWPTPA